MHTRVLAIACVVPAARAFGYFTGLHGYGNGQCEVANYQSNPVDMLAGDDDNGYNDGAYGYGSMPESITESADSCWSACKLPR